MALPVLFLSPLLLGDRLRWLRWIAIFAAALAIPMTLSRSGVAFALLGFILVWFIDRSAARKSWLPVRGRHAGGLCCRDSNGIGGRPTASRCSATSSGSPRCRCKTPAASVRATSYGTPRSPCSARIRSSASGPATSSTCSPRVGLLNVQTHANSLWLQTLAEQGLIGFIALLVLIRRRAARMRARP